MSALALVQVMAMASVKVKDEVSAMALVQVLALVRGKALALVSATELAMVLEAVWVPVLERGLELARLHIYQHEDEIGGKQC
jgi:hypothetical protein